MYRNSEGYHDPTAGAAMSRVMKEYRQKQKQRYADRRRLKVYVASRYAGDIPANTEAAVRCCRQVIEEGRMPIASHLLYPQMLDDANPEERLLGTMFGLSLLGCCDEVWVFMRNNEISGGMRREIEEAKRLGKRIHYHEITGGGKADGIPQGTDR